MKTVRLKNGAEVAEAVIKIVMMSINCLLQNNETAARELVMLCRDPKHQLTENAVGDLAAIGLVERRDDRYIVDEMSCQIVLSSAEGEGEEIKFETPY